MTSSTLFRAFAAAFFIFLGSVLAGCGSSGPDSVAIEFLKAVEDEDVERAYALLYIPKKDKTERELEVKGKVQMIVGDMSGRIKKLGGIESISVKSSEHEEGQDRAAVVLAVSYANGTEDSERFQLKKDGSEWKVLLR